MLTTKISLQEFEKDSALPLPYAHDKVCPICGSKFFVPDASMWAYKLKKAYTKKTRQIQYIYLCSWTCTNKARPSLQRGHKSYNKVL